LCIRRALTPASEIVSTVENFEFAVAPKTLSESKTLPAHQRLGPKFSPQPASIW